MANLHKTWQSTNDLASLKAVNSLIRVIKLNSTSESSHLSNAFNDHFSSIGPVNQMGLRFFFPAFFLTFNITVVVVVSMSLTNYLFLKFIQSDVITSYNLSNSDNN